MELHQRIARLRKQKGLTQEQVAEFIGISRGAYANYEVGKRDPGKEILVHLARLFEVNTDYLLTGHFDILGQKSQNTKDTSPIAFSGGGHTMEIQRQELEDYYRSGNVVLAPIVSEIACGDPIFVEDQKIGEWPVNPLMANASDGPYVWVKAKGDSMTGVGIMDGSLVLLRVQSTVDNGDIAAICIDKEMATLKRIYFTTDGVMLKPENPNYKAETYSPERIRIVGRAISHLSPTV